MTQAKRAIYDACGRRTEWKPEYVAPFDLPPVTHRIIYNRKKDGGVSVCEPSARALWHLQRGGRWHNVTRGWLQTQIERQIADNIPPAVARTFVNGMMWGGLTEYDAWTVIVQRDCERQGTMLDIVHADELPDQWFRDAWRRSPNGGPISIDLEKARPIQFARIVTAVERENKRRSRLLSRLAGARRIKLERLTIERAIAHARDEDELKRVWPDGLKGSA